MFLRKLILPCLTLALLVPAAEAKKPKFKSPNTHKAYSHKTPKVPKQRSHKVKIKH